MPRAINAAAIELVKEFEGFVNHWYPDPASGGKPYTCCYGHTDAAGAPKYADTKGKSFSREEGEAILGRDLARVAATLEAAIKVKVTDNQFGACVSLAYNIGETAFLRSTLLKKLNAADYAGVAQEFGKWNKARVGGKLTVMAGLSRRRAAEKALFLTPDAKPAPKPVPAPQPVPAPANDARNGLIGWLIFLAVAIASGAAALWTNFSHFIQGVLS